MSAWTYRQSDGKAASKIVPPRLRIPCWKGLGADSEEKREPASDIDTVVVDSLKALDPKWPIREACIAVRRFVAVLCVHFARIPPFPDRTSAVLHCSYLRQVRTKGMVQWRSLFTNT